MGKGLFGSPRWLALPGIVLAAGALAQAYPARPVNLVVAFTANSSTDNIARAVGDALSRSLGQPVVIRNRPGAGGTIAAAAAAKAEPDGYTFLVHAAGHAVNPQIYPNLPYDTARDFAGVGTLAILPTVLVAPPGRYKSVQDLVRAAKAHPGKLNFGSTGTGSAAHLNAEKFRSAAGFDAVHVPYKGAPEALSETMAGRLDFFFAPVAAALDLIKEGKLTALAAGTTKRTALLPGTPSIVELGYPGADVNSWVGVFAPAKTPRAIVNRMNQEVARALQLPEIRALYTGLGAEPWSTRPEEFDAYVASEIETGGRTLKAAGSRAN